MKEPILMQGDCLELMRIIPAKSVDLVVTSPPYDNLRSYEGQEPWTFEKFTLVALELKRVLKEGGVIVWNVADETIDGDESGSSFKQALFFKEIGLRLNDTMIWNKGGFSAVGALKSRYAPVFEYMFVFTKGKLKTFNPIKDRKNKHAGGTIHGTVVSSGEPKKVAGNNKKIIAEYGQRFNIWDIFPHRQRGPDNHPAPFPLALATDHIKSWSNPGDLVLDPFAGSGTTGVACVNLGRDFIGIEKVDKYFAIAETRINEALSTLKAAA